MTNSHRSGVGLFIVGICLIISCSGSELGTMTYEGKPFPASFPDEVRDVANASNEFSFDLFSRLRDKPGNVFFSPASILTAVSMAQAGAEKSTLAEMQNVLHASHDEEKWFAGAGGLTELLNAQDDGYELRLANRLWGQKNYSFRADYLERMEQNFAAPLGLLDFKNKPEPSRQAINDWVSDYTQERIRNLILEGEFDVNTRLVLVNAIYFQADWLKPFPEYATRIQPFTLSANKQVNVELMNTTSDLRYFEDANAQILLLPYKSDELSMVVVLPKDTLGLGMVEQIFTNQKLNDWIQGMATEEVEVYLPKFKTTFEISLNETLSEMGMPRAFSDEAEFGRMSSKDDLKISNAMHWAFVEVHEKGTKAVATTRIGEASKLTETGPPEIVFRADHPFLFFIRHNSSGAILFFGRLADPR